MSKRRYEIDEFDDMEEEEFYNLLSQGMGNFQKYKDAHPDDIRANSQAELALIIGAMAEAAGNRGITAWDVIKVIPHRVVKQEDHLPDGSAPRHPNRRNAESSISSTMSFMHLDAGSLSWDEKTMRMGGYGKLRRVYKYVPIDQRQSGHARKPSNRNIVSELRKELAEVKSWGEMISPLLPEFLRREQS